MASKVSKAAQEMEVSLEKVETPQEAANEETVQEVQKVNFDEKVAFFVPMGRTKEEQGDIVIAVNGKTIVVKRGVKVMIPLKYKLAYERAMDQDAKARYLQAQLENVKLN